MAGAMAGVMFNRLRDRRLAPSHPAEAMAAGTAEAMRVLKDSAPNDPAGADAPRSCVIHHNSEPPGSEFLF